MTLEFVVCDTIRRQGVIFNIVIYNSFAWMMIYLYLYKYENVCVSMYFVCVFAFFSAIWNPIGIPFGTKLLLGPEWVLKQYDFKKKKIRRVIALFLYFFKISL